MLPFRNSEFAPSDSPVLLQGVRVESSRPVNIGNGAERGGPVPNRLNSALFRIGSIPGVPRAAPPIITVSPGAAPLPITVAGSNDSLCSAVTLSCQQSVFYADYLFIFSTA